MVHYYLTNDSDHEVVAFTVNEEFLDEKEYKGLPVVPFESIEETYPPGEYSMYVAMGYRKMNKIRARLYEEAKAKGYELITYISSNCSFEAEEIGDNCFIFEENTIQPYVKIGNDVVIWSGTHVGHRAKIGDHCFISSQIVISGYVEMGPYCFCGVNATFRDQLKIGASTLIGAGAVIMKDTEEGEVYVAPRTKPREQKSDEIDF
jgi:sugar O-acyltransferase (sialic acid O-acetyltransferase NeuD family)